MVEPSIRKRMPVGLDLQDELDEPDRLHCRTCVKSCPALAVEEKDGHITVDHSRCSGGGICSARGICIERCPAHALKAEGELKSADEVVRIVMQDEPFYQKSGGGVTLSGGEAMMQLDFAVALLKSCKQKGLHTAIETTGFASPAVFQQVIEHLDLLLFDIKHWDEETHRMFTGVSNLPILANMKYAIGEGKEVLPRLPVIPGVNAALEDAMGFVRRLKEVGANKVQLLPFHQFGENKYHMLGREYDFAKEPALHPEDLTDYQQVFLNERIEAFF